MGARSGALAALVVLLAAALAAGSVVGTDADSPCAADGERKLCLADVSTSTDRIVMGESATLTVTVKNEGDVAANGTVVLKVAGPNGTNTYVLQEVRLEPGEETEISQRLDASTPGTHGLQIVVNDGAMSHRYDASEVITLEVVEESTVLGGDLDAPDIALVALVGALSVIGVITYRNN